MNSSLLTCILVAGLATSATAQLAVRSKTQPITPTQAVECGPGHPWQGRLPGVNPFSLARQTDVPIIAWHAPGGLPISFSFHHNSMGAVSNPALSPKWLHSFDTTLRVWNTPAGQVAAVVHGDHHIQSFAQSGGPAGAWSPSDGYTDSLAANAQGFTLTGRDHTRIELELVSLGLVSVYRMNRIVDRSGNTVTMAYDSLGRLERVSDASGRALRLAYAGKAQLSRVIFEVGAYSQIWNLVYDPSRRLVGVILPPVTLPSGVQTVAEQYAYDARNNIVSRTDRAGGVTNYGYDPAIPDRAAWEQVPGNTQRTLYTYAGPTNRNVADPIGVSMTYQYDGLSRFTRRSDAAGSVTSCSYADPDFAWAPSLVTKPSGTTTGLDYDSRGNIVGSIDAAGRRTDYSWDPRNNLAEILEPLVTDAWGFVEPARRGMQFQYDANDRPVMITQLDPVQGNANSAILYNPIGLPVQLTDPLGKTYTCVYDAYGNIVQTVSPAGRSRQCRFDTAATTFGFTVPNAVIDGAGVRMDLVRDEWGRLRFEQAPALTQEYQYDAMSRLTRTVDFHGTTDFIYAPQGWLTDEICGSHGVHYTRLANGLVASMLENGPGSAVRQLTYTYDPRGLMQAVTENGLPIQFTYDADGRLVRKLLPSGASMDRTYSQGRLTQCAIRRTGGALIWYESYAYQADGRLAQTMEQGAITRHGYDFLGRLVREERTGTMPHQHGWIYDAAGNRVAQSLSGQVTQFFFDPDGLPMQGIGPGGPEVYVWDVNGRLVHRTRAGLDHNFGYDFKGRLIEVLEAPMGGPLMPSRLFQYDTLDRRVRRDTIGPMGTQSESWYAGGQLIRTHSVSALSGTPGVETATWANGLAAWTNASGQTMYPGTDGSGSIRRIIDGVGQPTPYVGLFNGAAQTIQDTGPRPPMAVGADDGTLSEGDAGLMMCGGGSYFDPWLGMPLGQPAMFTAGIVTDVGELNIRISAQTLSFQTDGPIICQALFQRLAPRAPQYGAQITYAGERLEVYFDPAYTVTQGGFYGSGPQPMIWACPDPEWLRKAWEELRWLERQKDDAWFDRTKRAYQKRISDLLDWINGQLKKKK